MDPVNFAIWAAIALGGVAVVAGWRRLVVGQPRLAPMALIPVAVATISYGWLLLLFVLPHRIAPDYSDLRFSTIGINLAMALIGTVMACVFGRGARVTLALATLWVGILWCYVGVISSVV